MEKYDLNDLTFIIPLRVDSIDRLENLLFCTNYLIENFETHIIVWEADSRNTGFAESLLDRSIEYHFHEDSDPIFYRTHYINRLVATANTPFLAIWDADVIVPQRQLIESIETLRKEQSDFVYPYKDIMLNVPPAIKNIYLKSRDLAVLEKFQAGFHAMYGPKAIGGGFLVNRNKYIAAGMENENYYGWGLEDGERYHRWRRLGFRIEHIEGVMYHLDHSRGSNSLFHAQDQHYIKLKEQYRIRNISPEILRKEVAEWHMETFSVLK